MINSGQTEALSKEMGRRRLGGKVPCLPEGALTLVHPENTEVEAQAERF